MTNFLTPHRIVSLDWEMVVRIAFGQMGLWHWVWETLRTRYLNHCSLNEIWAWLVET